MKTNHTLFIVLTLCILFNSCSSDNNSDPQIPIQDISERESSCTDFIGYSGAYWDFVNDVEIPFAAVPEVPNIASEFVHSQLPITLNLPNGYVALETEYPEIGPDSKGVEVVNSNNSVRFTWVPPSYAPGQYIVSEDFIPWIRFLLEQNYGLSGDPTEICSELTQRDAFGYPQEINTKVLSFGNFIAQAWVLTSYLDEGTTFVIALSVAHETDYEDVTESLFLPLHYQLYMNGLGSQRDEDGDGFSFLVDPNDSDSNVPAN